ncbi:TPA: hypothetical protein KOR80_003943 [Clostridioides difficile]|nr:hypothetical protein [Clostridioides difficile]
METREEKIKKAESNLREMDSKLLSTIILLTDLLLPKEELSKSEIDRNEKCLEIIDLFMSLSPNFQDYVAQQVREASKLQTLFIEDVRKSLKQHKQRC